MSVDVHDFRKLHLVKNGEVTPTPNSKPGLEQKEVTAEMQTGNEDFDKLIRALAAQIDANEKASTDMAMKVAGAVEENIVRLCQFQFMYMRGKIDGFKEASNIPLQIMNEKKMIS